MMSRIGSAVAGAIATLGLVITTPAIAVTPDAPSLSSPVVRGGAPESNTLVPGRTVTESWRIVQDVSEKEAFELAKEANSIDVWEAYLVKFPHGFRAAIAKSYINKLRSENSSGGNSGSNGGTDTGGNRDVEYVRASEYTGPYRVAARGMSGVYLNNTRPGVVTVRPNALDRRSGHWLFEQLRGTKYIRIRNRWKGTYLHLDGDAVQARRRSRSDRSSHWTLERASDGSDHVVVRNRLDGQYLWTDRDDRFLFVSGGQPEGPLGHWRLVSMEENIRDDDYDDDDYGSEDIDKPRITCTKGYVKNGKCRCRSGRQRVKKGRNRFACERVKVKCSRVEYYSKSRKRCVCRKGYERVGSKCFRNEELDDDRGNTSCPAGFLLRNGYCVCPRGRKNIQGVCRKVKGGGTVRPKIRCSKIKFAYTRGNTCKCAGGRIFTGRACILPD